VTLSGGWKRSSIAALAGLMLLSACGGSAEDSAPPTLARLPTLGTPVLWATRAPASPAATPTSTTTLSPTPTHTATRPVVVATYTPMPSPTPTETPTPEPPTVTPEPTLTPPPTATDTPPPDPIALTSTAIAASGLPIQAAPSDTPAPTATPPPTTPPPTPTPPAIVFYSDRRGQEDIFLIAPDGTVRALTGAPSNEREPSCSPDGRLLVYASDASGGFQIVLQRLDTGETIPLTDSDGMNFAPVFSPDGRSIAFVSTRGGGIPAIWLMDADGANQRQLTTGAGRATSPAWGPDSRQVAFASEQDGRWHLMLTITQDELGDLGEVPVLPPEINLGHEVWPVFDPAGERIAFSVWTDLSDPQTADLYLLDYEQPAPVALRTAAGADIAWGWLDADRLLVSVGGPGEVQIAALNITSGALTSLAAGGGFNGGARPCPVDIAILPPEPAPPPTSTPTPTPVPAAAIPPALLAAQGRPHIVQPGENLLGISFVYGIPLRTLAEINALPDPDLISIGQRLTIPVTRTGHRAGGYQLPDSDQTGQTGARRKGIVVRLGAQEVDAFEDGRLLRTLVASTGLPQTPTVQGEFKIYHKLAAQTMAGPDYYLPNVPWVMYFYQGYGLHGTYWHNNFGQPMSHGCVNLRTPDARWLYEWAEIGTPVIVRP